MAVKVSLEFQQAVFAANHLRASTPSPMPRRLPFRRAGRTDRVRTELSVSRAVAIGENYLLIRATRSLQPGLLAQVPPPVAPDAMTKRLRQAARSFPVLVSVWTDDLAVAPGTTTARWVDFEIARDMRHVIVHRLGMWQPGLDPKPTLNARIQALGVNPDTYRGQLPVADQDLTDVLQLVIRIVRDLETALP